MRPWSPGNVRTWLRRARIPAGIVCLSVSVCGPGAWAAEYPSSALSASLGMAPELVDETSLLFRLPQRAGLASSQLFVLHNSDDLSFILGGYAVTSASSFGAVAQTHGHGFFLFAQPSSFVGSRTFLQAGWGGAVSMWRAGVALRGSREEGESRSIQEYASGPTSRSETWSRRSLWEASIGVGLGGEGASVDVVLDARRPEEEMESSTSRTDRPDTARVRVASRNDVFYETAGRARFPLGAGAEIVAVGSWGLIEEELESVFSGPDSLVQRLDRRRLERWTGGLALSFATEHLDWLALSVYWRHEEVPVSASRGFSTTSLEQILCSVAVQERLWRTLQARAGIQIRHEKSKGESVEFDSNSVYRWQRHEEDLQSQFSWGVSYSWRRFDARAAVQETLDLGNLLLALDVLVRL